MEIKNEEAFHKAYPNYILFTDALKQVVVEAWNSAIASIVPESKPEPEKETWEPISGGYAIDPIGGIEYIGKYLHKNHHCTVANFGNSRKTKELAAIAVQDYRTIHRLHMWLTEKHGFPGGVEVIAGRGNFVDVRFFVSGGVSVELEQKLLSGEVVL
jgi:hypothetical protein